MRNRAPQTQQRLFIDNHIDQMEGCGSASHPFDGDASLKVALATHISVWATETCSRTGGYSRWHSTV